MSSALCPTDEIIDETKSYTANNVNITNDAGCSFERFTIKHAQEHLPVVSYV